MEILAIVAVIIVIISAFWGISALNRLTANKQAEKLSQEIKKELSMSTNRKILTPKELQEYKQKNGLAGILVLAFIAVGSLIYAGANGDLLLGVIMVIPFAIIVLFLLIRDSAKVSKQKILYKMKAFVLNRTYGSYASCILVYYDFYNNDFVCESRTISTAAKGNGQLRPGNYIDIIAEQTSKKVKFVDYL